MHEQHYVKNCLISWTMVRGTLLRLVTTRLYQWAVSLRNKILHQDYTIMHYTSLANAKLAADISEHLKWNVHCPVYIPLPRLCTQNSHQVQQCYTRRCFEYTQSAKITRICGQHKTLKNTEACAFYSFHALL